MTSTRRALRIDDPLAPADACHVARSTAAGPPGRLRDVALDQIRPNPNQPRRRFDEDSLLALADSIRERGVLQPIIVRPREPQRYELIAGERRWRAARLAGLMTIPALVDDVVDDTVSLELALIENIARADLTVIEEARTIASLLDDLSVSRADLARRLGRSRSDAHRPPARATGPNDRVDRRRAAHEGPWQGAPQRTRPRPPTTARSPRRRERMVRPQPRGRNRPWRGVPPGESRAAP